MKQMTPEEIERANEKMRQLQKKWRREDEIKQGVISILQFVFYPPLAIAFKVIALLSKLIGSITAIGMPYGLYCAYKTVMSLKGGVPLHEIGQTKFILFFIVLPIVAFAIHAVAYKIHEYLYLRS